MTSIALPFPSAGRPRRVNRACWWLALIAILVAILAGHPAGADRIKDLGTFQGIRSNQLTGYGIVVGLPGTGDDNLEYTMQSVKAVASRFGLQLPPNVSQGLKNAAVVMVTAELPAFAKPGQRIDITVASLGKAKSLRGGALVLTPLLGADGQIYAMAQGNLAVGGLGAEGRDGSQIVVNVPSTGRIPEGATVERAVATGFDQTPYLTFNLARADFTTAQNVAAAINSRLGGGSAEAKDAVSIAVKAPVGADVRATLMSTIENLSVVTAEPPAKVIVNARTGTVVINSAVRVGPAAVTHGKLTVRIDENQRVRQPGPFSQGQTALEQKSNVSVDEERRPMFLLAPGPKLADVVKAVNAIGASPADLVAILEALKEAGALKAELIVL
ncbi:flagellar basal body P-ring protein FlgI [Sphingomonas lycopersici]|uniref:Flagellar P-ring protein n=1 Tax=Sphingomonas lycopersici TaxID=2951807 RepID=A0AA42CRK8_9SPHN|nr:flagellar basal body P-ring protein FlgI [Sphingomonas lycopersici]MCW6536825.1 flagellar basal body P-ring protein FlgI [Sphingomonas lycopersici]